jgi:phosphoadenosine phosphosulfate reductase
MTLHLEALNQRFASLDPIHLLRWGTAVFGPDIVVATAFGPSGLVILHAIAQIQPRPAIFYLQTDLFFPQTLALRDELAARFGLEFIAVRPDLTLEAQEAEFGSHLWQRDPDLCCQLRKVAPLQRFLTGKRAWVTGLRRDQSAGRAATEMVMWDAVHQLYKLNPLAHWTGSQVWAYIYTHSLPFNALHAHGYASIGCWPCTQPMPVSGRERDGRWFGQSKTECGIHTIFCQSP